MVALPKPESVNESNVVEMLRLAFRKLAEINDTSVQRDQSLAKEVRKTNSKLDQTNSRLDQTNSRLDQTNSKLDALRSEMKEQNDALRSEMKEQNDALRSEMNTALDTQTELLKVIAHNTRRG